MITANPERHGIRFSSGYLCLFAMPSTLDSGHLTQVSSHCTGSGASAFTSLDYGHQLPLQGLGGMRGNSGGCRRATVKIMFCAVVS